MSEEYGHPTQFAELLPKDKWNQHKGVSVVKGPVRLTGFRTGPLTPSQRGIFFGGDSSDVEMYRSLHDDAPITEHKIELGKKVLVAGHQADVVKHLWNKVLMDAHAQLGGGADGQRKLDEKIRSSLMRRGFSGIVYLNPLLPAKTEIHVFEPGSIRTQPMSKTLGKVMSLDEVREELAKLYEPALVKSLTPLVARGAVALLRANKRDDAEALVRKALVRPIRKSEESEEKIATKNEGWGFHGTTAKKFPHLTEEQVASRFHQMSKHVMDQHGLSAEHAAEFLDSSLGRHLADSLTEDSLPDGTALKRMVGYWAKRNNVSLQPTSGVAKQKTLGRARYQVRAKV